MREEKRKRLEKKGWTVGSADEFLGLDAQESAYLDLKFRLGGTIRERRKGAELTQRQLAKTIGSSQSRVAKMEAGDPSVSLDLQIRALLALGASSQDLASAISSSESAA